MSKIRSCCFLFLCGALFAFPALAANTTIQENVSGTVPFINAGKSQDGATSSTALGLQVNGTEMMRVTATGSVGIGTTTPTAALDLGGGAISMGYERKLCTYTAAQTGWLSCSCPTGKLVIGASCRYMTSGNPIGWDLNDADNSSEPKGASCFKTATNDGVMLYIICANIK